MHNVIETETKKFIEQGSRYLPLMRDNKSEETRIEYYLFQPKHQTKVTFEQPYNSPTKTLLNQVYHTSKAMQNHD